MAKRTIYGISAVVAVLVIAPLLAYATLSRHSGLDHFLEQRAALLEQLDANAMNLPRGFEHVLPPSGSASHPGSAHIRSVVRSGELWFGDSLSSYDLRIVGSLRDKAPQEILIDLFQHLSSGMDRIGFASPKSGGPDWIIENRRAAHSTYWYDTGRNLIVTISVVVDGESDSVHVTRYVHERFE